MKDNLTKEDVKSAFRKMVEMRSKWEYCIKNKISRAEAEKIGIKYADITLTVL